VQDKPKLSGL